VHRKLFTKISIVAGSPKRSWISVEFFAAMGSGVVGGFDYFDRRAVVSSCLQDDLQRVQSIYTVLVPQILIDTYT